MDTYEKKYNEALERARYVLHTVETAGCAMHKDLLTEIFPELAESEDERIRKELIEFIREAYSTGNAPEKCAKWLVWLEQDLLRGCNYNPETDTYTKNW